MMESNRPRRVRKASASFRRAPSFAVLWMLTAIAVCPATAAPLERGTEIADTGQVAPPGALAPPSPEMRATEYAKVDAKSAPVPVSTPAPLPRAAATPTAATATTSSSSITTATIAAAATTTASAALPPEAPADPATQTALALRYEHAEGVPKDLAKAHALYCKAAREGYLDAQFALGWMYANGRGVPRDDGIAAAFFEIAAEQGHPGASKLLKLFQRKPDTELPECMLPDPPVYTTIEHEVPLIAEDREADEPLAAPRNDIERLVYRIAPRYAVDPRLALAVITVESDFKPLAVSPKNAQGLMQLIPETATRFGVKRILNPVENINGGLAYLRWLLAFFKGDVTLVAAAYNAGERAVEKYRGVPPYAETRQYVKKITTLYKKSAHPYVTGIVEPSDMLAKMRRPLR